MPKQIEEDLMPGEFIPLGMKLRGRGGNLNARVQRHRDDRGVTVRIEDYSRPDFWAELHLTPAALREMLDPDARDKEGE